MSSGAVYDAVKTSSIASEFTYGSQAESRYGKRYGSIVVLSFLVKGGTANNTTLVTIPNDLLPAQNDYIYSLYFGNGSVCTTGSVWIEASDVTKIKYYGSSALSANAYVSIIYGLSV